MNTTNQARMILEQLDIKWLEIHFCELMQSFLHLVVCDTDLFFLKSITIHSCKYMQCHVSACLSA